MGPRSIALLTTSSPLVTRTVERLAVLFPRIFLCPVPLIQSSRSSKRSLSLSHPILTSVSPGPLQHPSRPRRSQVSTPCISNVCHRSPPALDVRAAGLGLSSYPHPTRRCMVRYMDLKLIVPRLYACLEWNLHLSALESCTRFNLLTSDHGPCIPRSRCLERKRQVSPPCPPATFEHTDSQIPPASVLISRAQACIR